jgi:hypothetical protein
MLAVPPQQSLLHADETREASGARRYLLITQRGNDVPLSSRWALAIAVALGEGEPKKT